jgi:membrane associated rhomboid family serine protease
MLWREATGSLSNVLVFTNVLVFLALALLNGLQTMGWAQAYALFGLSRVGILEEHRLFQFITAPFLHSSLTHVAFNMLSLWMLGPSLERVLGRKRYVVLTLLCAFSASVGFLILSPGRGSISMGYSGIIFGILVAQAMLFPNTTLFLFALFPLKMKQAVILLGAIELYLTLTAPNVGTAHAAHLFGAVAGFGYLGCLRLRARHRARRPDQPSSPVWRRFWSSYRKDIPHEL